MIFSKFFLDSENFDSTMNSIGIETSQMSASTASLESVDIYLKDDREIYIPDHIEYQRPQGKFDLIFFIM